MKPKIGSWKKEQDVPPAHGVSTTNVSGAPNEHLVLAWAHPIVSEWFIKKFLSPTEPQEEGWPHIISHKSVLISAPTGSGKTLAAFLACIDDLVRKSIDGQLSNRTEVLYVSPLKALSNDVNKNLEVPLAEIVELAAAKGVAMSEIRTNVRTGDTLAPERRDMLKRPPHILVTTPESLYILLTAEKSRAMLANVSTVIVDEIHAIADDKRGSHLALSLERLEALVGKPPVRIGLSATQKPIEEIARFLVGSRRPLPEIIQIGGKRRLDVAVEVPDSPLSAVASNEMWDEIYNRITHLVDAHRSTLVFVNTRKLAERVAHNLGERLGEEVVGTHHGSLSRRLRLKAEQQLKAGELKVLVATASLELGIDIGTVDLVCQIGSPRSIAVGLQRIGRAGHWRGAIPKGRLFATTRDELIECAALVKAIGEGELDRIIIPPCPRDVLAQQIVASSATNEWTEDELFNLVRQAYPYRDLERKTFDAIVEMLSEGVAGRKVRYGKYLHHDRINGRLKGRRGARLVAITNGGAIPDNSLFTVLLEPDQTVVGTIDEDFAVESSRGDIFLLGNSSWKIRRVEGMTGKIIVEDARGAPPTVPFWRGEAPSRTVELSAFVSDLRKKLDEMLDGVTEERERNDGTGERENGSGERKKGPGGHKRVGREEETDERTGELKEETGESGTVEQKTEADTQDRSNGREAVSVRSKQKSVVAERRERVLDFLSKECGLDRRGGEQVIEYIVKGRTILGTVPTRERIVAERFFDESGGMQLVIHAPFGGRINKAWGLALRKRFCRSFNLELQAAATDNGINISLMEQHSFPLSDVFYYLHPASLSQVLEQTALQSPLFTTRWRWDAGRALALLRFSGGKKVPPQIQRMRSEDLLAAVFPDAAACQDNIVGERTIPNHPLVQETMTDVLREALDIDGLEAVLSKIINGEIQCIAIDTPQPSEFSHEILNANPYAYLDDAPLEERRARAVEMRRMLPDKVAAEYGQLDPAAIEQVRNEVAPDIRDADELHDVLMSIIGMPEDRVWASGETTKQIWGRLFDQLVASGRATVSSAGQKRYWVATEASAGFRCAFGTTEDEPVSPGTAVRSGESAMPGPATSGSAAPGSAKPGPAAPGSAAPGSATPDPAAPGSSVSDSATPSPNAAGSAAPGSPAPGSAPSGDSGRTREDVAEQIVSGWLTHSGPVTGTYLAGISGLPAKDIEAAFLRLEGRGSILRGNFTGSSAELEWCDRALLARIHRLTIGFIRRQIEPVSAAQFMNWLLRWQHVAPDNQLVQEHGVLEVLRQLQGFEMAASAWEPQSLSRRVKNYKPAFLDNLCLKGVVGWARLSPHPALAVQDGDGSNVRDSSRSGVRESTWNGVRYGTRNVVRGDARNGVRNDSRVDDDADVRGGAGGGDTDPVRDDDSNAKRARSSGRVIPTSASPITFYLREDCNWMGLQSYEIDIGALTSQARSVLTILKKHGASFFLDIVRLAKLLKSEVEVALWELVTAGLVTADGFDNLRALIDVKRRSGTGSTRDFMRPRHSQGRWSLVTHYANGDLDEKTEAACWMLLKRYGVVFRELLTRETNVPKWREVLLMLRRLEAQGKIRGGRFVNGFLGEQFALKEAVESLRASKNHIRSTPSTPLSASEVQPPEIVKVPASDPLNLIGIIVPGPRIASNANCIVVFKNGAFDRVDEF